MSIERPSRAGGDSFRVPLVPLPMRPAIRVSVLSEDRMLREVLEAALALREDLEVVAVSRAGNEAVDVGLIDAGGDRSAALALTWEARERWPAARLIVVGLESEDESVVDFIEAGAGGYVLKGSSREELVAAIRAAQQGLAACSPRITRSVLARISALSKRVEPAPSLAEIEPLTLREQEILVLLAAGLGNKEVGRRLHITVQTVKNHVHRVLEKLRVHRRRDAVRLAYDLGLLVEPREIPLPGWKESGEGRGADDRAP
jgi:DNA-binding NarL/FixJ family response regulator